MASQNNRAHKITKDGLRISIGENIKAARMASEPKMTQEKVAELFNPPLTRAAIAQWEVGDTLPDIDRLAVLARAFGCTIDSLIFGDDEAKDKDGLMPEAVKIGKLWAQLDPRQRTLIAAIIRDGVERSNNRGRTR